MRRCDSAGERCLFHPRSRSPGHFRAGVPSDFSEVKCLGMTIVPSYVGEPQHSGVAERFMRILKTQRLYLHRFRTLAEAREIIGEFHGVDFKWVVYDTRRRFSLNYLEDPEQTFGEIAYLLGYSEVSAFNRAFKRWTGATPSDYRAARKN